MKRLGTIAGILVPLTLGAMLAPGTMASQANGTTIKGDLRDAAAVSPMNCYLDATVAGSWEAPTFMEKGRLTGVMRDASGRAVFQLDAELNCYIFATARAVARDPARPFDLFEAGGILGAATPMGARGLELTAVGQWMRRGDGLGRFELTFFLGMEAGVVPPVAVGAMEGLFMPDEEPGAPKEPGPDRMQPDAKCGPWAGGDCYRSPKRDAPDASGTPRQGGSVPGTASGPDRTDPDRKCLPVWGGDCYRGPKRDAPDTSDAPRDGRLPATVAGAGSVDGKAAGDDVLRHLQPGTFAGMWEVCE